MWLMILFLVIAYLLGSLCSAVVISKIMNLPDPRLDGSKNPGATNVLRLSGKKPAALTLLGDMLKGFIPVLVAKFMGIAGFPLALIGFAALLGHLFPIFFGFSGGKGVATALGVFLGLSFLIGVGAILGWIITFCLFRYSSLASLLAMLVAVVLTLLTQFNYFLPVAAMATLVVWRHWSNIQRLKSGTEDKAVF